MITYATNKKYTSEEIYELIFNYKSNLIAANRLKKEYIDTIAGGNIAQYGIEATLPKPVGQTSDPTYNEINRLIKQDSMIDRLENKVRYIQNRWSRIVNEEHAIVFNLALNGHNIKEISEMTHQSTRKVSRRIHEVSILLMD